MVQEIKTDTNALINRYGRMVSSICRRMIQDEFLAEDAAQEAWLKVIKGFPGFRGDSKLSTWIYTVVSREAMAFSKKEKLYTTRFLRKVFHSGEREVPYEDDKEKRLWIKEKCDNCLTGILHCLSSESRLIYILRKIVKLPYSEVAHVMQKEEAAVRKDFSRSRKKINNFMNQNCLLYNPEGDCHCRSTTLVKEINLQKEYDKIHSIIHKVNFFITSEQVLPRKNFWEKYLED